VDVFQGFYFGRPSKAMPDPETIAQRIEYCPEVQGLRHGAFRGQKALYARHDALVYALCDRLSPWGHRLDQALTVFIDEYENIECLYVLNVKACSSRARCATRPSCANASVSSTSPPGRRRPLAQGILPAAARSLPKFTTAIHLAGSGKPLHHHLRCLQGPRQPLLHLCADIDYRQDLMNP